MLATPFASVVPKELAGDDADGLLGQAGRDRAVPVRRATRKGQGATFVKNPAYWQAGQPYLDQIDYKTGQDDNAMLLQIEAGTLDMMGDPLPAAQFTRRDDRTRSTRTRSTHHTLVDTDYVFMDTQMPDNGPFSNVKVRQAVNYAIDKAAILQHQPRRRRRRRTASSRPTCPATTPRATRIRTTSRRPRR